MATPAGAPELLLRDIHLPAPPPLWPPAPGWWALAALVLMLLWLLWRWLRAWRRRRRFGRQFDLALSIPDPQQRLVAISSLLRRAARRRDRAAAQLRGEDWLSWLDRQLGPKAGAPFVSGAGRVLVDGLYAPQVDAHAVVALEAPARRCFLRLTEPRR